MKEEEEEEEFCLFVAPLLGCWRISQKWIREEEEEGERII